MVTSVSIATQNLSSGVANVNKGGLGNCVCVCISIAETSCHKRRGHKRIRRRYASHPPSTYWLLNLRKTQATTAQQPGFLTKHDPNTLFNLICIEQVFRQTRRGHANTLTLRASQRFIAWRLTVWVSLSLSLSIH